MFGVLGMNLGDWNANHFQEHSRVRRKHLTEHQGALGNSVTHENNQAGVERRSREAFSEPSSDQLTILSPSRLGLLCMANKF